MGILLGFDLSLHPAIADAQSAIQIDGALNRLEFARNGSELAR
jgi:hypothetical protein